MHTRRFAPLPYLLSRLSWLLVGVWAPPSVEQVVDAGAAAGDPLVDLGGLGRRGGVRSVHGSGELLGLTEPLDLGFAARGALVFGAAMLCGEAVITPAITVLGAVEGIKLVWPGVEHLVVPLSCLILGLIFGLQYRGTKFMGGLFGPVMLTWFVVLGAFGVWRVIETPMVLRALNPWLLMRNCFGSSQVLGMPSVS